MRCFAKAFLVRGVACVSALWCLPGAAIACDGERPIQVRANSEQLAVVIERLATQCEFNVRSTHDLGRTVDVRYDQVPVSAVLRRLLRQNNYLLLSDKDGRPLTLMIFGNAQARHFVARDAEPRIRADLTDADADRRLDAVLDLIETVSADEAKLLLQPLANDPDPSVRDAVEAALDALSPSE